ncbi:MAG: hypothetical protein H6Q15_2214, partial [Bacteroidetes bacterium]|nr:hypothetical protein [Bacteroidota bacterium]
ELAQGQAAKEKGEMQRIPLSYFMLEPPTRDHRAGAR